MDSSPAGLGGRVEERSSGHLAWRGFRGYNAVKAQRGVGRSRLRNPCPPPIRPPAAPLPGIDHGDRFQEESLPGDATTKGFGASPPRSPRIGRDRALAAEGLRLRVPVPRFPQARGVLHPDARPGPGGRHDLRVVHHARGLAALYLPESALRHPPHVPRDERVLRREHPVPVEEAADRLRGHARGAARDPGRGVRQPEGGGRGPARHGRGRDLGGDRARPCPDQDPASGAGPRRARRVSRGQELRPALLARHVLVEFARDRGPGEDPGLSGPRLPAPVPARDLDPDVPGRGRRRGLRQETAEPLGRDPPDRRAWGLGGIPLDLQPDHAVRAADGRALEQVRPVHVRGPRLPGQREPLPEEDHRRARSRRQPPGEIGPAGPAPEREDGHRQLRGRRLVRGHRRHLRPQVARRRPGPRQPARSGREAGRRDGRGFPPPAGQPDDRPRGPILLHRQGRQAAELRVGPGRGRGREDGRAPVQRLHGQALHAQRPPALQ